MSDSAIVTALNLVLALSGWATLFYDRFTHKPVIRGKVFQVIEGQLEMHGQRLTSYFVFLHLTNARRNSVTIMDYVMEICIDDKWILVQRLYGVEQQTLNFADQEGKIFKIASSHMIYSKSQAVEFGKPLQGFVPFVGAAHLHGKRISKYRVTCTDEFDHPHVIETTVENLGSLFRLFELAGIAATTAMTGPPRNLPR